MNRYRKTAISQYLVLGLILIALIGFGFLSTLMMQRISFTDHYAIPWAAGRTWLLEGQSPYSETITDIANQAIIDSGYLATLPDTETLTQPIINLFFYLPFSLLPYAISRAIWVTLSLLFTGTCVYLSLKLSGWKVSFVEGAFLLLLGIFWLPGVYAIFSGLITPLVLLLILASINLIRNEQETTAGFLLALVFGSLATTILILMFLTIWAISVKKWATIKAYFAGLAFILILSWLLLPSWFLDWLNIIINQIQTGNWVQTPLMAIPALLPGISEFLAIFLHAVIVIFLMIELVTVVRKSGVKFTWKLFALFFIAYLLNIKASYPDLLLVLPGAYLVFRFWSMRWALFGRLLSWGMVLLMFIGSWIFVLPEFQLTDQKAIPLLTVGLPIILLIGLLWIRWWAFRIPEMEAGY